MISIKVQIFVTIIRTATCLCVLSSLFRDAWSDFSDYPHLFRDAWSNFSDYPHCFVNFFRPPRSSEIAKIRRKICDFIINFHAGGLFHFKNRNSGAGLISPERGDVACQ